MHAFLASRHPASDREERAAEADRLAASGVVVARALRGQQRPPPRRRDPPPPGAGAANFIYENLHEDWEGEWLHVDLAGPSTADERGTGFGVALALGLFEVEGFASEPY